MLSLQPLASIACSWCPVLKGLPKSRMVAGGQWRGGQHRDISKGNSASDSHRSSQAETPGRVVAGNALTADRNSISATDQVQKLSKKLKPDQIAI